MNQPYIAECVVTERDGKLVAKVYPDHDAVKEDNIEDLVKVMEENRKKLNAELPKYEQVVAFEMVNEEFEKTPKKNIKRFKYI
jgi:long-chain acyl-CoA synthetase